jgi:hypothetical protein
VEGCSEQRLESGLNRILRIWKGRAPALPPLPLMMQLHRRNLLPTTSIGGGRYDDDDHYHGLRRYRGRNALLVFLLVLGSLFLLGTLLLRSSPQRVPLVQLRSRSKSPTPLQDDEVIVFEAQMAVDYAERLSLTRVLLF